MAKWDGQERVTAVATGRREDDSHTATLSPQHKPPAWSPFLASCGSGGGAEGESPLGPGAQVTFQQTFLPMDLGQLKCWG